MTSPFRPVLQRIPRGTELQRFKSNDQILEAWARNAATRLADATLGHRRIEIRRFLEQWGTTLVTELSVVELRTYIEVYAGGCRNYRRGGMTPPGRPVVGDRCTKDLDLAGCSFKCLGYEPVTAGTTDSHLQAIKDLYDYLVDLELLEFNLMEQAKRSWKRKNRHRLNRDAKKRHLNRDELLALYRETTQWDLKISEAIGCKCGPRASEIARLRVDLPWMDPDLKWMRVPPAGGNNGKRKGNDLLVIDNELRRVLEPYLAWRKTKLERVHGDTGAYNELVITYRGTPLPRTRAAEALDRKLEPLAIRLGLQRPDAERHEKVTSHCFRRFFSDALMQNGLYGTPLEVLRGDRPKNQNEYRYGNFNDERIRALYEEYAPVIGF